jgi:hypothetical protein
MGSAMILPLPPLLVATIAPTIGNDAVGVEIVVKHKKGSTACLLQTWAKSKWCPPSALLA